MTPVIFFPLQKVKAPLPVGRRVPSASASPRWSKVDFLLWWPISCCTLQNLLRYRSLSASSSSQLEASQWILESSTTCHYTSVVSQVSQKNLSCVKETANFAEGPMFINILRQTIHGRCHVISKIDLSLDYGSGSYWNFPVPKIFNTQGRVSNGFWSIKWKNKLSQNNFALPGKSRIGNRRAEADKTDLEMPHVRHFPREGHAMLISTISREREAGIKSRLSRVQQGS